MSRVAGRHCSQSSNMIRLSSSSLQLPTAVQHLIGCDISHPPRHAPCSTVQLITVARCPVSPSFVQQMTRDLSWFSRVRVSHERSRSGLYLITSDRRVVPAIWSRSNADRGKPYIKFYTAKLLQPDLTCHKWIINTTANHYWLALANIHVPAYVGHPVSASTHRHKFAIWYIRNISPWRQVKLRLDALTPYVINTSTADLLHSTVSHFISTKFSLILSYDNSMYPSAATNNNTGYNQLHKFTQNYRIVTAIWILSATPT